MLKFVKLHCDTATQTLRTLVDARRAPELCLATANTNRPRVSKDELIEMFRSELRNADQISGRS